MTSSQLQELRRLVEKEEHSSASAARQVGVPEYSAYYRLRQLGVDLKRKHGPDRLAQYGAYNRKTDELVAIGSAREVAKTLGIAIGSVYSYASRGTGKYQIVELNEDWEG